MAKGTRNKGGGGGGVSNKENNKTLSMNANNTDHSNTKASTGASKSKSKDKQKIDQEETANNVAVIDESPSDSVNSASAKKDHHKVQPTSTQIMLAQLIGGENMDELQKTKIQQVMDITGKPEDAVATALFDAGWDENRAVDLLLEDGDHLTAWEETGKKNRKKQKQSAEDKDETEDLDAFNGEFSRDKSGKRGPPRMRRGGPSQGGDRSSTRNNKSGELSNGGFDQGRDQGSGRGRGDQPPRRGGRGGGARGGDRSSHSGRGRREGRMGKDGPGSAGNGGDSVGGFQGSIDTWNPSGSGGEGSSSTSGRGGGKSRGGHHGNSKDAFDNAGNWGDDFPAADDWDNEEYTGSLADTKVFTASGQAAGAPQSGKNQPQSQQKNQQGMRTGERPPYPPHSQQGSQPSETVSSGAPHQQTSTTAPVPSSAAVGASSYSQPIDLSTLLHKPTTQSSIGSNSQQTLLQFTQQATDSLKAAVGIGQQPNSSQGTTAASGKTGDQLYSSYASSTAAGGSAGSNQSGYGGNSAFTSIKSSQAGSVQPGAGKQGSAGAQSRSRMPPPSKIPNSAVEMPGDQLGRLDVQFGGLDLQFGGGGSSANSDSVNSFEFNGATASSAATTGNGPAASTGNDEKFLSANDKTKSATGQTSSSTVDKSGLSAMSGGKLGNNDSFSDSRKSGTGGGTSSYSSRSQGIDKNSTESMSGYHGGSSQNYNNYGHSKSSYGQHGQYGSNQNYQSGGYGNSYNQNSYSNSATTGSNNYPKSNYSDGKTGFQGDSSNLSANNAAAAVLGLTSTTNALSGKISATSASKVNIPNLPPGVNMLPQHYMAAAGLPAAAFYGLQQPAAAMYSAYGNTAGLEDLAALQRASGLHTLVGSASHAPASALAALTGGNPPTVQQTGGVKSASQGYYDPNSQYAATSLAAAAAGNRGEAAAASMNLNSLVSTTQSSSNVSTGAVTSNTNTMTASSQSTSNSTGIGSGNDKSGFGNVASDSTSSPVPSSTHQNIQQQNTATQQQQPALNFAATSAFAQHQQATLPPGYAYFYGQVPNLQAAYGGAGVYPATMAVPTVAGGTAGSSQFQKSGYSYGSAGYDSLQPGSKDFGYNSASGKGSSGNAGTGPGGAGKGHQYWGNNLTNSQLW